MTDREIIQYINDIKQHCKDGLITPDERNEKIVDLKSRFGERRVQRLEDEASFMEWGSRK